MTSEIIGWYGVVAIITAYGLNNFGMLSTHSFWYVFLNLSGSLGIVYVSLKKKNYQPAVLNIVWAIIALLGLVSLFR